MMMDCQHGFYMFYPEGIEDCSFFEEQTGFSLVQYESGLTFEELSALPDYSIKGQPYGNLIAKVNFAGHPADVLRANGFVFDWTLQKLRKLEDMEVDLPVKEQPFGGFISTALPQAGGTYGGKVLLSFTGAVRFNSQQFSMRTYEWQDKSL